VDARGPLRRWSAWAALAALVAAGAGLAWAWPTLFPAPLAAARAAYDRGDFEAAAAAARLRLRTASEDREALRLLARASARLKSDDTARRLYERLGIEAMAAEDYFLVSLGLLRHGQPQQAVKVLKEARNRDPDHPGVLYELARLGAGTDHLAEAAEHAKRLTRVPGWEARGYFLVGLLRHEQAEPEGAVAAFERALQIDPKLKQAATSIGDVHKLIARDLLALGRPQPARAHLRVVLDAGHDPEASWLLSRAGLQQGRIDEAVADLGRAGTYAGRAMLPEPAPYVGSARCAECHRSYHRAEQTSRHARTYHPPERLAADLPLPDRPIADPEDAGFVHTIQSTRDRVVFETLAGSDRARATIRFALGSGDHGLTPVGSDAAGRAIELRLSHYGGAGWDMTTGHDPHPKGGAAGHLGNVLDADSVRRCLDCHTTNYRTARDRIMPTAADHGIGCERCHGPGGHHLEAIAAGFPEVAIASPKRAGAAEVTQLCARCHSSRLKSIMPQDPTSIRFQGTTLTWSRCYTASRGALGCTTCHDPHRNAETADTFYEGKCLACHAKADPAPRVPADQTRPIALADDVRRVPCPVNPATGCITCHMPRKAGIVPHFAFTDHFIRVHRDAPIPPAQDATGPIDQVTDSRDR
jgi:tetratricopeptide (TPR) repeat protein